MRLLFLMLFLYPFYCAQWWPLFVKVFRPEFFRFKLPANYNTFPSNNSHFFRLSNRHRTTIVLGEDIYFFFLLFIMNHFTRPLITVPPTTYASRHYKYISEFDHNHWNRDCVVFLRHPMTKDDSTFSNFFCEIKLN